METSTPTVGQELQGSSNAPTATQPEPMVQISAKQLQEIQDKLKMLESVADKGRLFNYESQQAAGQKKAMKVRLSRFAEGIIVGWKTAKDVKVFNPTTGKQVGEEYQVEVDVLKEDGTNQKVVLDGYPTFSDARNAERIEATVVGRKENMNGEVTYDVALPDGRTIELSEKFVN